MLEKEHSDMGERPNDIVSNGTIFWITMLCLFTSAALFSIGPVWMVLPIILAICVLVLAVKFGWGTLTRDD